VVCALGWRRLRAIDHTVGVRSDDIVLLRRVPMLRPLPVPVIEQLAEGLAHAELGPGEVVFEAGDIGDSFYVIADGSVEVLDRGRLVRTMGSGEGFGEIALLGATTRTMTIRAVGRVEVAAIRRAVFLPAITSTRESRSAAEAARRAHLRDAPGSGGMPGSGGEVP